MTDHHLSALAELRSYFDSHEPVPEVDHILDAFSAVLGLLCSALADSPALYDRLPDDALEVVARFGTPDVSDEARRRLDARKVPSVH